MAGKNKILRWFRLYVGGYDVSGDGRSIGSLENKFGEVDFSGWSETVYNYLSDGRRKVGITGFSAHMNDATGGTITSLQDSPVAAAVTAVWGDGAEPAVGDLAYLLPPLQVSDTISFDAGASVFNADFQPDTAQYDTDYDSPMGVVLMPLTSIGATTNGTEVDLGADGAAGAVASLHITATSSGDFAFTIEHSDTGAWGGEEATLITFSSDGSAIGSEFGTASGAVEQYLRFVATRTAGTVSVVCAIAVN